MADSISIKVEDAGVYAALRSLQERGANLLPVMRQISGVMLDAVEQNFEEEGRPAKWKPSKRALAMGGKTLQRSQGGLAASMHESSGPDYAAVGTNKPYAAMMHFGSGGKMTIRAKNKPYLKFRMPNGRWVQKKEVQVEIPARPFMTLTDGDIEGIKNAIMNYIIGRST